MDYRLRRISDIYISAGELPGDKDTIVTIEKITTEKIIGKGGKKTTKGVLYFRGWDKGMVFGSGVGDTIRSLYGKDDDAWLGKSIALHRSTTKVGPDSDVPCIRVRPTKPSSGRADPQPNKDAAALAAKVNAEMEAATTKEQVEAVAATYRDQVKALPKELLDLVLATKAGVLAALEGKAP